MIQKLEDPKKYLEICQTQKNSGNFVKPRKIAKKLPTQKNRIWPNFKPKKIGRASLSKLCHVPPGLWDKILSEKEVNVDEGFRQ